MFNFSSKTVVNKEFKLLDILKQIKADKDVKADAMKIDSIMISNIINARNLNSIEDDVFKEIYIFKIKLNRKEIPMQFIEALDKSIRFHTYFVFEYQELEYTMMCFKEIGKTVKLNKYFYHDFSESKIIDIPMINTVCDVYKVLYSYEVNLPYKDSETSTEFLNRSNIIKKLQYQISQTEKAIVHEVQPKKKFEYHTRLQQYKKELEQLL